VLLHQGGGRKGLPKSFLNRFTRVHIELLRADDLLFIAGTVTTLPRAHGLIPTTRSFERVTASG
jgi:midasin